MTGLRGELDGLERHRRDRLLGALAVAVSLGYLAMQVREFRRQAEIDLNMRFLENADRVRTEVWTNAEVAAFLERCLSAPDPLPSVDLARYSAYLSWADSRGQFSAECLLGIDALPAGSESPA